MSVPLSPAPSPARNPLRRLSPFEQTVLWLVLGVFAAILLLMLRGDQVGIRPIGQTPLPDADAVAIRAPIVIKFDTRLDAEQPLDGKLTVTGAGPAAGQVELAGDEIHFAPTEALTPNTLYTVTVTAGLLGANGRELLDPVSWSFRTGATSVAYTSVDAAGYDQLYRVPLGAANAQDDPSAPGVPLTAAPLGIWDFTVAADGGLVVYSALTAEGGADLWRVSPGGEPALLYACPRAACSTTSLAPQGSLLAFSRRNVTEMAAAMVSPPRLWLLDVGSGEAAPVFDDNQKLGFEPRWSSDGAWLSYISPDQVGVGVINLDDGREGFYPTSTGEAGVWHPRHPRFLLSTVSQVGEQPVTHIMAVDAETGGQVNLSGAQNPVEDNSPIWSPDGEWIAFRRKEFSGERASPGKQIWLMRADGAGAYPLTLDPAYDHGTPAWSPDGALLSYHRFPLRGPEIVIEVVVLEVSSGVSWVAARPGQRPQWIP